MKDRFSCFFGSVHSIFMSFLFFLFFLIFFIFNSPAFCGAPFFSEAVYNPTESGNSYFVVYFSEPLWGDAAQTGPVEISDFTLLLTDPAGNVRNMHITHVLDSQDGVSSLLGGADSVHVRFSYDGYALGTERIRIMPSAAGVVFNSEGQAMASDEISGLMTMNADQITVIYAAFDAAGLNNGTSWANAFTNLQSALASAQPDSMVWIKNGTYKPGTLRSDTFNVPAGVSVYGGFAGTETALDQRVPTSNPTVLSGDIGVEGTIEDNCYHVVSAGDNSLFDNITIMGGYADAVSPDDRGACMYSPAGTVRIRNSVFMGASARLGGGLYTAGTCSIDGALFYNTWSSLNGGGIYIQNGQVQIKNALFYGAMAAVSGGCIYSDTGTFDLVNSNLYSNFSQDNESGAVYASSSSGNIINSIIRKNNGSGVSGIKLVSSSLNIKNSNINGAVSALAGLVDLGANIDSDPGFSNEANPLGADNTPFTYDDGFMPLLASDMVDAGSSDGASHDCINTLRPTGFGWDIGAYEYYDPANPFVTVTSVSAQPLSGVYKQDQVIAIAVTFSGTVNVTGGNPRLALETGLTDRYAQYSSGSGTSVLNFSYTVAAGDITSDLACKSTAALELQGVQITSESGQPAVLSLPVPGTENSLSGSSDIIVDTLAPVIEQALLALDNSYIDITFSEPVTGQSGPVSSGDFIIELTPNSGDAQSVSILSVKDFSDQNITGPLSSVRLYLDFIPVPSGPETIRIKPISGTALFDSAQNSVSALESTGLLQVNEPSGSGPVVLRVTSDTPDGYYKTASVININVVFSAAVNVTGQPVLVLETGDTDRNADYVSGSGTSSLVFSYQVQAGDFSPDLDYVSASALQLTGGTIKSVSSDDALLGLPLPGEANSLSYFKDIAIDTIRPKFVQASVSEDNTFINILFSKPLTGASGAFLGVSDFLLTFTPSGSGAQSVQMSGLLSSQGTQINGPVAGVRILIDVSGTPAAGDTLKIQPAGASFLFSLSGEAMESSENTGNIPLNQAGMSDITVTSVSAPLAQGVYGPGMFFDILVNFSAAVNVTLPDPPGPVPEIILESGYYDIRASYVGGSGTASLLFRAQVLAGASSRDLDYTSAQALVLNNSSLSGLNGQQVITALPLPGGPGSLSATSQIVIDTLSPSIVSAGLSHDNAFIEIDFSEPVSGPPASAVQPPVFRDLLPSDFSITFSSGGGTASSARILSLVKTDTSSLTGFNSVIRFMLEIDGQVSGLEKIEIAPAQGTSICDSAGNPMSVSESTGLVSLFSSSVNVPRVLYVQSVTPNGLYAAGQTIETAVKFSSPVTYTGTPVLRLALDKAPVFTSYPVNGPVQDTDFSEQRFALVKSGKMTDTLVFAIQLKKGDNTSDLDYFSGSALFVLEGSLTGISGEKVSPLLPSPGLADSLSMRSDIAVDTTPPFIQGLTLSNDNSRAVLTFSEKLLRLNRTPIAKEDLVIEFDRNSGTALAVSVSSIRMTNGNAVDQPVSGIEIILHIDGKVSGTEKIRFFGARDSIMDAAGNILLSDFGSDWINLNSPALAPAFVTGVFAESAQGIYKAGEEVKIGVRFSSKVSVTGTPRIRLFLEPNDRYALFSGFSASCPEQTGLVFTYTVQSGDYSSDLGYSGAGALELNSGTITGTDSQTAQIFNASLTLPPPGSSNSLAGNSDIVIDAAPPVISSAYLAEDNSFLDITFSQGVSNSSGNALTLSDVSLNFKANLGTADNVSITGIAAIDGTLLKGNDKSVRLFLEVSGSISGSESISAGPSGPDSIRDAAGNAMSGLESTGDIILRLSTGPVSISSIGSASAAGFYSQGSTVTLSLAFTGRVTVTGQPFISLETGPADARAFYVSGSGSSVLLFNYTVGAGHVSSDLNYTGVKALNLNNGTITASPRTVITDLFDPFGPSCLAAFADIVIDTQAPALENMSLARDNSYIDLYFSEPVMSHDFSTVSPDDFTLSITSSGGSATAFAVSQVSDLFNSPLSGPAEEIRLLLEFDVPPNGREVISIAPAGADVIIDRASNSLPAWTSTGKIALNSPNYEPVKPVKVFFTGHNTETPVTGLMGLNDKILISVYFSRGVAVTGVPELLLDTGVSDAKAFYVYSLTSNEHVFEYTAALGHYTPDLGYAMIGALDLAGGSVKDSSGIDATLSLPAPGSADSLSGSGDIMVDASAPKFSDIFLNSDNSSCTVIFSENIFSAAGQGVVKSDFDIQFFQNSGTASAMSISAVTSAGGSQITGGVNAVRFVFSITGQPDGTETFRIVPAGEDTIFDAPGNAMSASASSPLINLNSSGQALSVQPYICSVDSPAPDGIYKDSSQIQINLSFSENVTVQGIPRLKLNVRSGVQQTGLPVYAAYVSGSGSSVLAFDYIVEKDQTTLNYSVENNRIVLNDQASHTLDTACEFSLVLNSDNSIKSLSGTDADPRLPVPGSSQSISGRKKVIIDSVPPFFTHFIVSPDNTVGRLVFSEPVSPGAGLYSGVSDFQVLLNKNGGSLENVIITAVETLDGQTVDQPVDEMVFHLETTGTLSGAESISLVMSADNLLFDPAGNSVSQGVKSPFASLTGSTGTGAGIISVSSVPIGAYLKEDDFVDIILDYSGVVYISGTPVIILNSGSQSLQADFALAKYYSGSGTDRITFRYTVKPGHNSSSLDYIPGSAFDPAGSNILSAGGAAAGMVLPLSGSALSLSGVSDLIVDTQAPGADKFYVSKDNTFLTLGFTEPVTGPAGRLVTKDDFSVEIDPMGGTAGLATIVSVHNMQGASVQGPADGIRFFITYDNPPSGLEKIRLKIEPSSLLTDLAGNTIEPLLPADQSFYTDWTALNGLSPDFPKIISLGSPYSEKSYKAGETIIINTSFDMLVNVTGTPRIKLNTGDGCVGYAGYVSGSGTPFLEFTYTVQSNENVELLSFFDAFSLENVNGMVTGANGAALLRLPSQGSGYTLPDTARISIDTEPPFIKSAVLSGDNSALRVEFSEKLFGTGQNRVDKSSFTINFDSFGGFAQSASISALFDSAGRDITGLEDSAGYDTVYFMLSYDGQISGSEGFEIRALSNQVFDRAGNAMSSSRGTGWITLNSKPLTGLHIESIAFTSPSGGYGAGETISFTVKFSENIILTGSPEIKLETGDTDRYALLSDTLSLDTLEFSYVVELSDFSPSLDYFSSAAFELKGASIISEADGRAADLTLPVPGTPESLSGSADIVVDTIAPQFISAALAPDNSYIDILFDSPVFADPYGTAPLSASRFTLVFNPNSGTAENAVITQVNELLADGSTGPSVPGAARYRLMLDISNDASGSETVLIRARDGYSIFDIAGNPMAPEAGTGLISLNKFFELFKVSGTVRLNSLPMADVSVTLVGMTSEITDSSGNFLIENIPGGNYYLVPGKAGYLFEPDRIALTIGPDRENIEFNASEGVGEVVFGGIVKDGDQKPVKSVLIQISGKSSVETNEDGRWLRPGITSGVYTITPYKENYSFTPVSRQAAADVNHLDLDFDAVYTGNYFNISGMTATAGLVPIKDVTLRLEGVSSVQSSESGEYFFGGLQAGTYIITAFKEGYAFEPASRTVSLGPASSGQDFTGTFNASPAGAAGRYLKFTYSEFNNPAWFQLNEIKVYDSTLSSPGELLPVSTVILSKPAYPGFEKEKLIDNQIAYNNDLAIRDHGGSIVITIDFGSNKNFHALWHYSDGEYGAEKVTISSMSEGETWKDLGTYTASLEPGQSNLDIFQFTGRILINEIKLADPSYTELVNTGNTSVNLRHWSFYHNSGVFSIPDLVLLPGQYVLVHEGSGTNSVSAVYTDTSFSWTSAGQGYAYLVDHQGKGMDFVKWNGSDKTPPSDLVFQGPDIVFTDASKNLGRDKNHLDTDNTSDFFVMQPSPGAVNIIEQAVEKYNISGQVSDYMSVVMKDVTVFAGEYSAVTDTMGKFTILNVPAGTYDVAPRADGFEFEPQSISVDLQADVRDLIFIGRLPVEPVKYDLAGTVYLSSGTMEPLAGIDVKLDPGGIRVTTGIDGKYRFNALAAGNYTVTPVNAGYDFYPASKDLVMDRSRLSENFTASVVVQTYQIEGYVKEPDGTAISGTTVEMVSVQGAHEIKLSNTSGYYIFNGLKQDYYRVAVGKQYWEFSPAYQDIPDLNENKVLDVFVGAQPEYELSGFVTNISGQGVQGVTINISGLTPVETDAFGAYRKIQIYPGKYEVTPVMGDVIFNPPVRTVYFGPDQQQVNFSAVADLFSISGKVYVSTGSVLQNVKISVTNADPVYTSGLGEYTVSDLPAGSYTVTPFLEGYIFDPLSSTVTIGPDKENVVFNASPRAYSVSGTLYDHLGIGISGISVFAGDLMTYSDINGKYTFNNVLPGEYSVMPVSDIYTFEPSLISARVGPDSLNNNFSGLRTYSLSGKVTDDMGAGVEGAGITVDSGPVSYSDSSGNYVVSGLSPGTYRALAQKEGYIFTPAEKTFTITGSNQTENFQASYIGNITIINVDKSYTGTSEDGSQARPYKTIESAVNASAPGTVVSVAAGTYSGSVVLPYGVSIRGQGPDKTFIDGAGAAKTVQMSTNCSISGITVKGGSYYSGSSGIYSYDSSIDIKNCVITNCYDGIRAVNSKVNIRNITVYNNYGDSVNLQLESTAWISSSILNRINQDINSQVFVNYSDIVQGGSAIGTGTGNISNDPAFNNTAAGDYKLKISSPCIDMGDPAIDLRDTDLTRNDMGAFGGPADSSTVLSKLVILAVESSVEPVSGYGTSKLYDNLKNYNSDFAVLAGQNNLELTLDMGKDILTSKLCLFNDGLYGVKSISIFTAPADNPSSWTKKGDYTNLLNENASVVSNEIAYTGTTCRYIKIIVTDTCDSRWVQLNEIEVMGIDPGGTASQKIIFASVLSSAVPYQGYGTDKLYDNIRQYNNDYAVDHNNEPLTISIDLGNEYSVDRITVYNDGLYGAGEMGLFYSTDAIDGLYSYIASFSGLSMTEGQAVKNSFTPSYSGSVRYIRMVFSDYRDARWCQFNEIEVTGLPVNAITLYKCDIPQISASQASWPGFDTDKLVDNRIIYNSDFAVYNPVSPFDISMDLGITRKVKEIRIYNDGAFGSKNTVLWYATALAPLDWKSLGTFNLALNKDSPKGNIISITPLDMRYIKLRFESFESAWFQLNEIEVYSSVQEAVFNKLAIAQVTTTAVTVAGMGADKLFDNSIVYNSEFAVARPNPTIDIIVDMGADVQINSINHYNDGSYGAASVVIRSCTATAYPVFSDLTSSENLINIPDQPNKNVFNFTQRTARYLKFSYTDFNNRGWFQLCEYQVFGSVISSKPLAAAFNKASDISEYRVSAVKAPAPVILNIPDTDTPGIDTPGTDTPGTDTPGTDAPGSSAPGPDIKESDKLTENSVFLNLEDLNNFIERLTETKKVTKGKLRDIIKLFKALHTDNPVFIICSDNKSDNRLDSYSHIPKEETLLFIKFLKLIKRKVYFSGPGAGKYFKSGQEKVYSQSSLKNITDKNLSDLAEYDSDYLFAKALNWCDLVKNRDKRNFLVNKIESMQRILHTYKACPDGYFNNYNDFEGSSKYISKAFFTLNYLKEMNDFIKNIDTPMFCASALEFDLINIAGPIIKELVKQDY